MLGNGVCSAVCHLYQFIHLFELRETGHRVCALERKLVVNLTGSFFSIIRDSSKFFILVKSSKSISMLEKEPLN